MQLKRTNSDLRQLNTSSIKGPIVTISEVQVHLSSKDGILRFLGIPTYSFLQGIIA